MEENIKMEKVEYLTEEFKDRLSNVMSVPATQQLVSVLQFALESFYATDREGWREGVVDGLCRQVTKIAVADTIECNYRYRGPWNVVERAIAQADEEFGIRKSIKDVFFAEDGCIDLEELETRLNDYWGDIFDWYTAWPADMIEENNTAED